MFSPRRCTLLSRTGGATALALLALLTPIMPAAGAGTPGATGAGPATVPAVVPAVAPTGAPTGASMSDTGQASSRLRPKDPGRASIQIADCRLNMNWTSSISNDDFLEERARLAFAGTVDCDFALEAIYGEVGLTDSSPSYDNESFLGRDLGSASMYGISYSGSGAGSNVVDARTYNGGRRAGGRLDLFLVAPSDMYWENCYGGPTLAVVLCEGLGTNVLHVGMAGLSRATGLTQACRDQSVGLDAEQQRLAVTTGGPVPASTQILRRITPLLVRVTGFRKDLCALTSQAAVLSFADLKGMDLWRAAVQEARQASTQADDRALYWARLSMTAALRQWKPAAFPVSDHSRADAQRILDRASRGMTSHNFTSGAARKALVSGFDPFNLDSEIMTSNPSGASVLRLDDSFLAGAEVQAVIFPVRYQDFDQSLVEDVFRPHLTAGPQQASLITTVSQGGDDELFELEFYNGSKRWVDHEFPDNLRFVGAGTGNDPWDTPWIAPDAADFVQTTLPVDAMYAANPATTVIDTSVVEQYATLGPTSRRDNGPLVPWSMAVAGSGGGFLSNEIAYRVTLLRDQLRSPVPAGHVHTPLLDGILSRSLTEAERDARRVDLANKYLPVLSAGITAPARPPIRLTTNSPVYLVGQVPVYTVTGPPNAPITWTSTWNGALFEYEVPIGTTDASGSWTGAYHPWYQGQAGQWVKYVRVNGRLAEVPITVI